VSHAAPGRGAPLGTPERKRERKRLQESNFTTEKMRCSNVIRGKTYPRISWRGGRKRSEIAKLRSRQSERYRNNAPEARRGAYIPRRIVARLEPVSDDLLYSPRLIRDAGLNQSRVVRTIAATMRLPSSVIAILLQIPLGILCDASKRSLFARRRGNGQYIIDFEKKICRDGNPQMRIVILSPSLSSRLASGDDTRG